VDGTPMIDALRWLSDRAVEAGELLDLSATVSVRIPGCWQATVAPDTPPIMVCGNPFPLVRGVHSNPLRSRARRFESCRGH
jgi:hypothetical protein